MWWIRLAAAAAVALALYGAYWSIDRSGYNRGVAEVEGKYRDAALAEAHAHAERIKTAQEKHDADQKTIARLAADARRLRVSFPTCATSSESSDGRTGVFQSGVDELFAELQSRTGTLVERCDRLNIDAIRMNNTIPD